ncbi:MAG: hypothetical protein E7342_01900 [Clostridiales bacterium]|nr:hypothetical protein [Clostridiales bacterium]
MGFVKEIGSEFDYNSTKQVFVKGCNYFEKQYSNYQVHKFRSGRDALKSVAIFYKQTHKKVLLPALCCESMVSPFLMNGYEIDFYKFNEDISIDLEDVCKKITEDTVFLYQAYFGIEPISKDNLEELKRKNNKTIFLEDRTHVALNNVNDSEFMPDVIVASIRKWVGLPDGGLLFSKDKVDFEKEVDKDGTFSSMRLKAMRKKSRYLKNKNKKLKEEYLEILKKASLELDLSKNAYKISKKSEKILSKIDFLKILDKRINNINLLKKLISSLACNNKIKIIDNYTSVGNLYFPIFVENRDLIQSKLAKNGVYCPVIWPIPNEAIGVCEVSESIANNILALPIDQRYNEEDMKYIADTLESVLR